MISAMELMGTVFSGLSALVIEDAGDDGGAICVHTRTKDEAVACPAWNHPLPSPNCALCALKCHVPAPQPVCARHDDRVMVTYMTRPSGASCGAAS